MQKNNIIDIAYDTFLKNKGIIIFVNTKRSAEKQAEDIAKFLEKNTTPNPNLNDLSEKILKVLSNPSKQCKRLAFCLKQGSAFHHSGLHQKQKEIIEDAFRDGILKIICGTTTLAAGVDLPAFRTLLKDVKRFTQHGLRYIPVLEYHQMAGRAGRPAYDKFGESILIAKTENEKETLIEKYIKGEPENIYSKLAVEPILRSYVLSLISTHFVRDEKQLFNFFSKTFWAFQYKNINKLKLILLRILGYLEEWQFIKIQDVEKDFVSANNIDEKELEATKLGKRVSELYIDPYTANKIIQSLKVSNENQNKFSYLQMIAYTLEMRPLLKVRVKELEQMEDFSTKFESITTEPEIYDSDYDEWLNSIKTAQLFYEWINENTEDKICEIFNTTPGEIKVKLDRADWLLYATEELAKYTKKEIIKDIIKLRLQIKNGAKEELLNLLRLKGIGRIRARKLFNGGIKTIYDVKKTDVLKISQLIGKSIAENIKKQI